MELPNIYPAGQPTHVVSAVCAVATTWDEQGKSIKARNHATTQLYGSSEIHLRIKIKWVLNKWGLIMRNLLI